MSWKLSRTVLRGESGGNIARLLDKKEGKTKQPYYFQMKDESVFSFAGIWDTWKTDGREIISCAIITTTPNELLSSVHNRMPVILHPGDFDIWLGSETKTDDLSVKVKI